MLRVWRPVAPKKKCVHTRTRTQTSRTCRSSLAGKHATHYTATGYPGVHMNPEKQRYQKTSRHITISNAEFLKYMKIDYLVKIESSQMVQVSIIDA